MVKMHKLTKGGQTIFPATIYDAVVNPNTRKSLTTELSELENEEIYLKTQIEGSIDKDLITENTVWIDGTWDWETNSSAGNSIQKQNYKHTKLTDVGYYDTLKMSGLSEKVDASDIFPSISIYSGSEQIEYLRGSSAVINMDKYSDRSNINIIIQAKQDNSIIPSVIANSKAKVVKPEELIPIQSSLKKIEGSETDVVDALVWNKKRWETGTNQPNGGELQYNATQKIWYARIDISEYDSIICDGLLNGSSISTSASTLNGICIYGDNILIKGIKDASNENIINRSDYSQYSKLELILQCKSTSDNEFIAVGEPSVRAIIYSTIASKNEFDKLSLGVNQNSSDIGKIYNLIEGVDNKDIFSLFVWNKRRWLTGTNQPNGKEQNYNSVQKLWSSNKFDISDYDTVTVKGLSNNISISNSADKLSSLVLYGNDRQESVLAVISDKGSAAIQICQFAVSIGKQHNALVSVANGLHRIQIIVFRAETPVLILYIQCYGSTAYRIKAQVSEFKRINILFYTRNRLFVNRLFFQWTGKNPVICAVKNLIANCIEFNSFRCLQLVRLCNKF